MYVGRGKSIGTGQPLSFRCASCRSTLKNWSPAGREHGYHVELTGRQKPYYRRGCNAGRYGVVSYQYRCLDCGHVGWSAHETLARLAQRKES